MAPTAAQRQPLAGWPTGCSLANGYAAPSRVALEYCSKVTRAAEGDKTSHMRDCELAAAYACPQTLVLLSATGMHLLVTFPSGSVGSEYAPGDPSLLLL